MPKNRSSNDTVNLIPNRKDKAPVVLKTPQQVNKTLKRQRARQAKKLRYNEAKAEVEKLKKLDATKTVVIQTQRDLVKQLKQNSSNSNSK